MMPETTDEPAKLSDTLPHFFMWAVIVMLALFSVMALLVYLLGRAPASFPTDSSITIDPGSSVSEIVAAFEQAGYVRSSDLLYAFLVLEHDTTDIRAGIYTFQEPVNTRGVAEIITEIGPQEPLASLTFPEGITVEEIAAIADRKLEDFDSATFLSYAREHEGYLFPDTYFVPDAFTDEELFDLLRETYEERVGPLRPEIEAHALDESEVITLASIIEREANSLESMQIVSSILQNRLSIDMALQADATIGYVLDKPLAELKPEDLELDSPYNTYEYPGLTPTPIGNPGLDSIQAVLKPADTKYLYYITDESGTFHYAETFDEHRANIARYLR